jgi:hypothetical protein
MKVVAGAPMLTFANRPHSVEHTCGTKHKASLRTEFKVIYIQSVEAMGLCVNEHQRATVVDMRTVPEERGINSALPAHPLNNFLAGDLTIAALSIGWYCCACTDTDTTWRRGPRTDRGTHTI